MKKIYLFILIGAAFCFSKPMVYSQDTSWFKLETNQVNLDTALFFRIYVVDLNNDHYPDIVTIRGGATTGTPNCMKEYMNIQDTNSSDPHDRIFVDVTAQSGINDSVVPPLTVNRSYACAAFADVNNDGNVDMVTGVYYYRLDTYTDNGDRDEVWLGDGKGHFSLVHNNGLHELGLINTSGFSFLDYNKDGNIDLYIPVWFKDYTHDIWSTGFLMKGNGDGTFTNVTTQAGMTNQYQEPMYGSTVCDWNNDGWPDICTAPYCRDGGQLWKNNGNGTFTNVAASVGYNSQVMHGAVDGLGARAMCMWQAAPEDYDNDGDLDFFFCLIHGEVAPGDGHSTLVINGGPSNGYHLDWALDDITWKQPLASENGDYAASWLDFENDGLEDIFMTQAYYDPTNSRSYFFHQNADHTFTDVTQLLGMLISNLKNTHMCQPLDYDRDGDDDILVSNTNANNYHVNFIKNNIGQNNHWVGIDLNAPVGVNKSCIGARIKVYAGNLTKMREVSAGKGNFAGQQPFSLLFGLGNHTSIDSIKIFWPNINNLVTTIKNPPIDKYIQIPTGVNNEISSPIPVALKVYPNPAQDFILLQLTNNSPVLMNVQIFDMLGNRLKAFNLYNSKDATKYCSIRELPAGTYVVHVTTANGYVLSQKFIKL